MNTRFNQAIISLITLALLAACSAKPKRHEPSPVPDTSSQSSNQFRHYPLYHDDDVEPSRHGRHYSQEFPRPAAIEPQVAFWRKVYSKWGRSQIAVHDKVHMDIIYDVFDLPGDTADIMTSSQKEYIQDRMNDWRSRLSAVEDKVNAGMALEPDEKELVQYVAEKTGHRNGIQGASERLRHQRGMKERFMRGIEIGRRYDGQFRQIFRNAGLPEDLAYLPHVESSFQYNAHSSAGALGIWQFTAGAAKMFMNGDSSAAARLDPINATRGAARYLAYAYDKLGSWPLAVTSYNHGIGGMQRAKSLHGHDFMHIVKHYNGSQFGFASRNYYAEFLAARDIVSEPERYFSEGGSDTEHYAALAEPKPVRYARPALAAEPQEAEQPVEELTPGSTTATVVETSGAEPTPVAQPEPEPTPAEPVVVAEAVAKPIAKESSQPESIYQPEPIQAEPTQALPVIAEPVEATNTAVVETELTDAEDEDTRIPYSFKTPKPAVTTSKKPEKPIAMQTEPKKAALATPTVPTQSKKPGPTPLPVEPKKLAATKPPAASPKATTHEVLSDPKKATKTATAVDPKHAQKLAATDAKTLTKASSAAPKASQLTAASHKSKSPAFHEAEKKTVDKVRVAKR